MPEQPAVDMELNDIPPAAFAPSTSNAVNGRDRIETFFCRLTSSDATMAADAAGELSRQIASGALSDSDLKAYLEKGGMKPFATRQANLSLLKKWADESPQRRPYFLLSKAQLIAACVAKFGGSQSSCQREGKEELIQRLALRHFQAQNHLRTNPIQSAGIRSDASGHATRDSLRTSLLKKIVEASFMPRLTAKGKEFCKSGHQLEGRTALDWAYEPEKPIPKEDLEQIVLKSLKNIDYESFVGFFFLWRFVSTRLPQPLPVLERIVPSAVSHWNAIKGGSDTKTKLIWLNMYDPPTKSTRARAIARMLLLGGVIIHRLHHVSTSKSLESYPSLQHFRNAATKRSSFHETLLSMVHAIRFQNFQPRPQPLSSLSLAQQGARTRRMDTRMKLVEWGNKPLGATPHKNVKSWYGRAPASYSGLAMEAHVRAKECTGKPVFRVNPETKNVKKAGSRSNCVECHMMTNFFCISCRKWLCSPQLAANREMERNGKLSDDLSYFKIIFTGDENKKGEEICGLYSCWHKAHEAAWEEDGAFARGWRNHFDDDCSSLTSM